MEKEMAQEEVQRQAGKALYAEKSPEALPQETTRHGEGVFFGNRFH